MIANQAHYHFLIKIQGHLLGQYGYSQMELHPPSTISGTSHTHGRKPSTVHSAETKTPKPSNATPQAHSPTNRNLTHPSTKEFIAVEITTVRRRNQTRRNQDKADKPTDYRQMLRGTFDKKQYGRTVNLLTEEFSPRSTHMTHQIPMENISSTP